MSKNMEKLLRLVADYQQFSNMPNAVPALQDELSEDDLYFVAAAQGIPPEKKERS